MARRRSLWGEILRAQGQSRREAARAQREWVAAQHRAEQAMLKVQRDAQRKVAANAREQERLLHEAGAAEAARLTSDVEERVIALRALLTASLADTPQQSFAAMRRRIQLQPFDPGSLAVATPERLRLIEGAELKHLLAEHLGLDVRIGLDRKPPRRKP